MCVTVLLLIAVVGVTSLSHRWLSQPVCSSCKTTILLMCMEEVFQPEWKLNQTNDDENVSWKEEQRQSSSRLSPEASALAAPTETHTGQRGIRRSKQVGMLTRSDRGARGVSFLERP